MHFIDASASLRYELRFARKDARSSVSIEKVIKDLRRDISSLSFLPRSFSMSGARAE